MTASLTPWFRGQVKPARRGVYERALDKSQMSGTYSYWTGKQWMFSAFTTDAAASAAAHLQCSIYQDILWRGLSEKPK